ncbi:MAG: LytTR family DNA-binding domain-containing protein [Saprospiraceae bacterium]
MKAFKKSKNINEAIVIRPELSLQQAIKAFGRIIIPDNGGYQCCMPEDILYVQSVGNYSEIYYSDGNKKLLARTLKDIEKRLPHHSFFRIHRSYVVNAYHIKKVCMSIDACCVHITGNHTLPISREKRKLLIYKGL